MHRKSNSLKGFGGVGVVEIVSDRQGNTYRCFYTVRFAGSVYLLHAFPSASRRNSDFILGRQCVAVAPHGLDVVLSA